MQKRVFVLTATETVAGRGAVGDGEGRIFLDYIHVLCLSVVKRLS